MPPAVTTREDLKRTVFTITVSWDQGAPWACGGIIKEEMPPGCFGRLDPPIAPLQSGHDTAGLKTHITAPEGALVPLTPRIGKVDDDGRIILFFAGATRDQLPERSIVRFMEA